MKYKNLGRSGLKVSVLSYGNMTSGMGYFSGTKDEYDISVENHHAELMQTCINNGINFFDTAELYGNGLSELYLGNIIQKSRWNREDLVLTTKFAPRMGGLQGNSRKRLRAAMKASLKRLQQDYVDVVFLHRPDDQVPLIEQVRTMNEFIEKEKAHYWGTSEFDPRTITEIFSICDRFGFVPPVVDQAEYNMLARKKIEVDFVPLYDEFGYGVMTWSPQYGGMLSGKYNDGIPPDSRFAKQGWSLDKPTDFLKELGKIATSVGSTQSQLALAWCLANKDVTTVLFGSTSSDQIVNNVRALQYVDKLTPEVEQRIETVLANRPEQPTNWRTYAPKANRRNVSINSHLPINPSI